MLHFELSLCGEQVGDELSRNPEDAMWALETMASRPDELLEELPELIAGTTAENVVAFLRNLADAIDNRS